MNIRSNTAGEHFQTDDCSTGPEFGNHERDDGGSDDSELDNPERDYRRVNDAEVDDSELDNPEIDYSRMNDTGIDDEGVYHSDMNRAEIDDAEMDHDGRNESEIDDEMHSGEFDYHLEDGVPPDAASYGIMCEPMFTTDTEIAGHYRGFCARYYAAISCGTAEEVCQLLTFPGFDIDTHDDLSPAVLQSLARGHMAEGVFVLLEAGANASITDISTGTSALQDAILNMTHGCHFDPTCAIEGLAVVNLLLYYNADIEFTNKDKRTALHLAAMAGQPDVVKILLDQGAYSQLNLGDKNSKTPREIATGLVETHRISGASNESFKDLME